MAVRNTKTKKTVVPQNPMVYLKDYRPPRHQVDHVYLDVHIVSEQRVEVSAILTISPKSRIADKKAPAFIEMHCGTAVEIVSMRLNGVPLTSKEYRRKEDRLYIPDTSREVRLEVETVINPKENKRLSGLYVSGDMLVTQCESEGFRTIIPFIDRSDNSSTFTTRICADKRIYPVLLSNGNAVKRETHLPHNEHAVTFDDPTRKPSYLFALVAAKLEKVTATHRTKRGRKISLAVYAEPGMQEESRHALRSLGQYLRWDEEAHGLEYPLNEYKIVITSKFNFGAMENHGLNIFNASIALGSPKTTPDYILERIRNVVGHEGAHTHTGNAVTIRDWCQYTVKEGLTRFREQEFGGSVDDPVLQRIDDVRQLRSGQFEQDASPVAHPVRPDRYASAENLVDATIYDKGAELYRMIQTLVGGKKNFSKCLRHYLKKYHGGSATLEQQLAAFTEAIGFNVMQLLPWYTRVGTPRCTISSRYNANKKECAVTIEQVPARKSDAPYYFPFTIGLIASNGRDMRLTLKGSKGLNDLSRGVLHVQKKKQTFVFINVQEQPVVSVMRNFSAPMKVTCMYTTAELRFLMRHDSDLFNRYEASSRLALRELRRLTGAVQRGTDRTVDQGLLEAFGDVLRGDSLHPGLREQILTLPSVDEMVQSMKPYDYESAYHARRHLVRTIARTYEKELFALYRTLKPHSEYRGDSLSVGKRMLRNRCLKYLIELDGEYADIAYTHMHTADNMTDETGGFESLVLSENRKLRDKASAEFYKKWKHNPLVLNRWLRLETQSQRADYGKHILHLETLPEYDRTNPTTVMYLYEGGLVTNVLQFHHRTGRGYKLLTDKIIVANKENPNLASRLVRVFSIVSHMDAKRQKLIRTQLRRIAGQKKLSAEVKEMVMPLLKAKGR